MDDSLMKAMKAKAFSLGHVFDEDIYKMEDADAEGFICVHCNELYVYFIDDDELIGGRAITDPNRYGDESIINAPCPVQRLLS